MNLSCVLGAELSRSMEKKKSQNLSGWLSDIFFFFTIDLLFCNSWFEWKFYRPNFFFKKNHLTSWIHQLAIQSCKCSFGDIYQNLQTECCFFCNVSIKKDPMIHYAVTPFLPSWCWIAMYLISQYMHERHQFVCNVIPIDTAT